MSLSMSRALLRRPHIARLAIRNASSTSEAASSGAAKVQQGASQATSKASEGLTRVTSTAGPALNRAGQAVTNALGGIGGRTGRMISFVQSLIPPTLYYGRVGLELGRLVAQGRKMMPPDVATFQSHLQPMMNSIRTPTQIANQTSGILSPSYIMNTVRNMDNQQLVNVGIVAAEAIGFFTVGEMIGRMKLIGYRTSGGHGEHH